MPSNFSELIERSFLRERYLERGWSVGRMAADLGCSKSSVRAALRRQGIRPRPRGRPRVAA